VAIPTDVRDGMIQVRRSANPMGLAAPLHVYIDGDKQRAHCEARLAFWPSFRSVARVTD